MKIGVRKFLPIVAAVLLVVALVVPTAVVGAPEASATRTLPTSVAPGADFDVAIEASGCGAFGQVVETLPSGFSYVSCASTDVTVTQVGSTVKFTFIGDSVSFDYTVTASTTAGTYSFSGVVKDEDRVEYTIGGDTNISVVAAGGTSATRTLPTSVAPGADFTVGIEASGCGAFGQVVETLPSGFSYVSCASTDVTVTQVGSTVKFTFIGDSVSFDYTVTASTTAGTYSFSGVVKDEDRVEYTIGGDTNISVVAAGGTSATRTLPASVGTGANFDVTIEASGCGAFGQVVETLPSGFSYVSCASTDVTVTQVGSTLKFTFIGDSVSFDYTVAASSTAGTYSFSGIVKDEDTNEYATGGDTEITVGAAGAYDRLLTLNDGWTLLSTDKWIDAESSAWVGTATLVLKYTADGFLSATFADLEPVEALYVKMPGDGWAGLNYSDVAPGVSAKDLVAGWNLISSATADNAAAVLSPLRYIQVGQQQGVGLTTLVSQGSYNVSGVSFYLATLTDADWSASAPTSLAFTMLSPFDGYWVYMNAAKSFGVIPE